MDIDPPPPPSSSTKDESKQEEEQVKGKDAVGSNPETAAADYPDMALAQSIHKLTQLYTTTTPPSSSSNPNEFAAAMGIDSLDTFVTQILSKVQSMENPSLSTHLQSLLSLDASHDLYQSSDQLNTLTSQNKLQLQKLEEQVVHQKENAGDMEVLEARIAVARFVAKTGTKEEALKAYEGVLDLPKLSSGKVMDALMECTRICSFYGDVVKNSGYLERISKLAEQSGDWDRRNRLKIYKSLLSHIPKRQIQEASKLLLDCIATFSCNEICTYTEFIQYTMLTNILHLPRTELKKKILDGPEILSVATKLPHVKSLVESYYNCDYQAYLQAIVKIAPILSADRYLAPHAGYLLREYHVLGYQQFLDAYKSVTLESMATSFGVSVEFLDLQLSRFIAAGRLTAKIDKFGGVVETRRPDRKNAQYRECIQKGDLLLNRIQKLARVVDL